jgi:uncharacterized membrane protein HdeD (DUF308 family)/pimeloyl-ACP methyl ester carboxylesterase
VRWSGLVVGLVAVVAGVWLMFKPFTSLAVLTVAIAVSLVAAGVGEVLGSVLRDRRALHRLAGVLLTVTGLVALALPGTTIHLISLVVGAGMVVSGLVNLVAGIRGATSERYSAIVGGVTRVLLGAVALSWPDVTLLVVALLVGPIAIVLGISQLAGFFTHRDAHAPPASRAAWVRWARGIGVTAALVVAVGLAFVSIGLHRASPTVDAFYAAPANVPEKPGELIRSEPFARGMPAGSHAWRILYTTTDAEGGIGLASGLVLVGSEPKQPHPVVAWTHGTTGVAQNCAPTLLADPLGAGATPAVQQVIDRGWALVATDYIGLGTVGPHPYLVGKPEAYSELDAVRAARQLTDVTLTDQTVAWGHSQGGGAALWVGIESKTYAPDVPLTGVAALAPASDLPSLMTRLQTSLSGKIFGPFMLYGYSHTYPDVTIDDYVRPAARTMVDQINTRCLSEPATLISAISALVTEPIFSADGASGPLGQHLQENVPDKRTGIPTFIAQGGADDLILPAIQARFVETLCSHGQIVEYHTYAGLDHVGIVTTPTSKMPADLLAWTADRFAGKTSAQKCTTQTE